VEVVRFERSAAEKPEYDTLIVDDEADPEP